MSPEAKNWTIGILSFIAGIIVTIIGFVVLTIYVSFIREKEQDNPPAIEEVEEVEEVEEECRSIDGTQLNIFA